jgi:hypothetical protein
VVDEDPVQPAVPRQPREVLVELEIEPGEALAVVGG